MARSEALDLVLWQVGEEVNKAQSLFPPINTPHEGFAVIKEELDELWELIKDDRGASPAARAEAMQVAAMAVRYIYDLAC